MTNCISISTYTFFVSFSSFFFFSQIALKAIEEVEQPQKRTPNENTDVTDEKAEEEEKPPRPSARSDGSGTVSPLTVSVANTFSRGSRKERLRKELEKGESLREIVGERPKPFGEEGEVDFSDDDDDNEREEEAEDADEKRGQSSFEEDEQERTAAEDSPGPFGDLLAMRDRERDLAINEESDVPDRKEKGQQKEAKKLSLLSDLTSMGGEQSDSARLFVASPLLEEKSAKAKGLFDDDDDDEDETEREGSARKGEEEEEGTNGSIFEGGSEAAKRILGSVHTNKGSLFGD